MSRHILIAEDDDDIATLLELVLTEQGYQVTKCDTGTDCVILVETIKPSLILLDINMPAKDGIAVLKELRKKGILHRCPAVMISGESDKSRVAEAISCGASDFIVKPFDLQTLPERIGRHLERVHAGTLRDLLQLANVPDRQIVKGAANQLVMAYPITYEKQQYCLILPAGLSAHSLQRLPDEALADKMFVFLRGNPGWSLVWPEVTQDIREAS